MDESASKETLPSISTQPSSNWAMGRAIISAGVFGTIGAVLGSKLGKNIRNSVVEPTLKWSMASFWAMMAAYSSLKASAMERGVHVAESVPQKTEEPIASVVAAPKAPHSKAPLSLVEVDTLQDHQRLQEAPLLQRM